MNTNDNHPRYSGMLDHAERDEFLPFVHELASVALAVVRRHYLQGTAVELKGDDTPVTVADGPRACTAPGETATATSRWPPAAPT